VARWDRTIDLRGFNPALLPAELSPPVRRRLGAPAVGRQDATSARSSRASPPREERPLARAADTGSARCVQRVGNVRASALSRPTRHVGERRRAGPSLEAACERRRSSERTDACGASLAPTRRWRSAKPSPHGTALFSEPLPLSLRPWVSPRAASSREPYVEGFRSRPALWRASGLAVRRQRDCFLTVGGPRSRLSVSLRCSFLVSVVVCVSKTKRATLWVALGGSSSELPSFLARSDLRRGQAHTGLRLADIGLVPALVREHGPTACPWQDGKRSMGVGAQEHRTLRPRYRL
jgi:hypothetical protein